MAHKFVISPATKKLMGGLFEALSDELQEHRDAWEEQFDHLLEELDGFADEPDA